MDPSKTLHDYSNSLNDICSYVIISLVLSLVLNVTPYSPGWKTTLGGNLIIIGILGYVVYVIIDSSYPIINKLNRSLFDVKWNNVKLSILYNAFLLVFILILIANIFKLMY